MKPLRQIFEIKISDGTDAPFGEVGHGRNPMDFRKTKVPMSKYSTYDLLKKTIHRKDEDFKEANISHDKLRATQMVVHKDWHPGHIDPKDTNGPMGMRDKEGLVHLMNGHHRADHAVRNKQPLKVSIVDQD